MDVNDTCFSAGPNLCWYALRTRSNHEKLAAAFLEAKGFEHFLPLYRVPKRLSDRLMERSIPLFPGYLFCRFDGRYRGPVLSASGVVSIISFGGKPAKIEETEIAAIQKALGSGQNVEPYPYLQEGQQIRIENGPLRGMKGILVKKRCWRIVISVQLLHRSIAVEIDPDSIAPIHTCDAITTGKPSAAPAPVWTASDRSSQVTESSLLAAVESYS